MSKENDNTKDTKKANIILTILFLLFMFISLINLWDNIDSDNKLVVGLFGLREDMNYLVVFIFIPILLSFVTVIIFPLIFVPLILKIKNMIWTKYNNGYLPTQPMKVNHTQYLKRALFIFLLLLGLNSAIISFGTIDIAQFIAGGEINANNLEAQAAYIENPIYYSEFFLGISSLLFPIVVGLLSVSWAMQDAGLMHYRLPKDKKDLRLLYEIEPVYLKYNSIIKGYAGISGLLYLAAAASFHMKYNTDEIAPFMFVTILMTFASIPAYFFYVKLVNSLFKKKFQKGLKEIPILTEDQFENL